MSGHSTLLGLLRHVQAATALENALLLNPDLAAAHEDLSILYGERMFLDAALEHRRRAQDLMRRGDETQNEFSDRVKAQSDAVQRLEQLVQDHRNEYAIRSKSMAGDPLGRARLALELGLAQLALDEVLLQNAVQSFGGEGARLQMELLLQLGRAEVVRGLLDDSEMRDNKTKLELSRLPAPSRPGYLHFYRVAAYEWLRFLQAAATGDYAVADEALEQMIQPLASNARRAMERLEWAIPVALCSELGLTVEPQTLLLRLVLHGERGELMQYMAEISFMSLQQADLCVLGGLLATERGAPTTAVKWFDAAVSAAAARGNEANFAGAALAAAYRRRLQEFQGAKSGN
jgi:hypothetical protein